MKTFKDFLDFVNALVRAWPIMISALALLISIIVGLSSVGTIIFQLSVPLPLLIAASALMLYPIAKVLQWLTRRTIKPFKYAGLLWKPSRLSFRYPIPLCPRDGCGCEIIFKAVPSVNIETLSGPFLQARSSYRFTYECPIHGILSGVPDSEIAELQRKAWMVQNRHNTEQESQ